MVQLVVDVYMFHVRVVVCFHTFLRIFWTQGVRGDDDEEDEGERRGRGK